MSAIHNHQGQHCWMVAPVGRLMVQNYRVISEDLHAGKCRIEKTDAVYMNPLDPQAVDPEAPVHRLLNPPEFGAPAVSVHIYSRPIDQCVVYSEDTHSCGLVTLSYTVASGIERSPA
jgi:NitT/TauT family transport system ATP-binding protein